MIYRIPVKDFHALPLLSDFVHGRRELVNCQSNKYFTDITLHKESNEDERRIQLALRDRDDVLRSYRRKFFVEHHVNGHHIN